MSKETGRRKFLKTLTAGGLGMAAAPVTLLNTTDTTHPANPLDQAPDPSPHRPYNTPYTGENLNRIAFPIGGIGAGMFCLEGTGAISHLSVRNRPEIYNEPALFTALHVRDLINGAKVLEGPVPTWKIFGPR